MQATFTSVRDDEISFFKRNLKDLKLQFFKQNINQIDIEKLKDTQILSIFVYDKLTQNIISKLKNLKLIITRSVGYDHIDIDYCRKHKITVAHIPEYSPQSIAEHTFCMILNLTRKLKKIQQNEDYLNFSLEKDILGIDLYTLSIGIIGTGRIGSKVAKIAYGYGMKIYAYDIKQNPELKDLNVCYVDLEFLIKKSDVITLHVPYLPTTHHLIDKNKINIMKKGVILINTSRGKVIDTDAVYNGVLEGKIGGIGLDVFEDEEILILRGYEQKQSSDKVLKILRLRNMDNVIITPHVAFFTEKAVENIKKGVIECINLFKEHNDVGKFKVV